ncbi:MAG: right-handed parallel beta-helix repeat-containing protein [Deltaproteobacteria bacterium]|nr:right-handed parallel beta-helix repeat-containing protein [Deltaproteobacteria bacterium]
MKVAKLVIVLCAFICLWSAAAGATVRVNQVFHPDPDPNPPDNSYYTYDPKLIDSSTTWTAAAGPYIIENTVTVAEGVTLTIETGTVVQVNDGLGIYVNGVLNAGGATFTHNQAGYWRGIYLAPTAGLSVLSNCNISYAGAYMGGTGLGYYHNSYRLASIYLDACSPQVTGCQISNSETHGIELWSSQAQITSNTFSNMGGAGYYPIVFDTLDTFPVMSGNSTSGSGENGIAIPGGSITTSGSWDMPGSSFPYLLNGWVTVAATNTLTIDPGVTVKAQGNIGLSVDGTLSAVGTSILPITFTSRAATPAAGNWTGIYLSPNAGASALSYVTINYAGAYNGGSGIGYIHNGYRLTAFYVDSISPPLTNVSVLNSETNGLELYAASPAINNATLANCAYSGLWASVDSRPTITNSAINNNGASGYYAVSLDATSVPDPTNVTFSGNSYQGIQNRGGTLAANATWKLWSTVAPYAVTGDVGVAAGVTLTINPTVTVKFSGSALYVSGTLSANSTSGRITFTSLADDSIAGDTNGNGSVTVAAAGNWKGIYLSPNSGSSVLANCNFSYAGAFMGGSGLGYYNNGYRLATLYLDDCNPQISGSQISNSETHGIELWSSQAQITSNTFSNMGSGYYPIVFDTLDTFPVMSGNSTGGSGENGIAVPGGTIATSGTWNKPGSSFPYLLNGSVSVALNQTLTVDPGVTVKANGAIGIYVNGTLSSVGTSLLPITFTSRAATPAAGNWSGIYLSPTAGASALSYVTINYAGAYNGGAGIGYFHNGYRLTAFYVDSISPPLTNVSVLNSATNGLELYAASPAITNSTLANCAYSGLWASVDSRPAITNSVINNNGASGYYAVSLDATSVPNPTNVTFSGNSYQGIQNRGGTLAANATWKLWSTVAPYAVTGDVGVATGVTLTINPTATVKLSGSGLYIYGTLSANSTSGRITFTSLSDDSIAGDTNGNGNTTVAAAGNWKGIYLSPDSGSSVLANCNISYAGAYLGGAGLGYYNNSYRPASMYVNSCSPQITGCQISSSETHGIEFWSSQAQLTSNTFSNMGGIVAGGSGYYPIVFDTLDTFPVMSGNSTSGSGENGIAVPGGTITTSGTWDMPGSSFPYLLNGWVSVAAARTLTIDPGVTVKAQGSLGPWVDGTLSAVGTSILPISFTSRAVTPAAGNWSGIYLSPNAGASALSYVTINYAGAYNGGAGIGYIHNSYRPTSFYVDSISPLLTNISVLNSATNGLELYAASPSITDSTFAACGWTQVVATGSSQPNISNSRFIGNSTNWGLTTDTPTQGITAQNNYWGSATGPTHATNPGGTGVKVSDGVDFSNFRNYFTSIGSYLLTVSVSGAGSVYSSPDAISCDSGTCSAVFSQLQTVTLTAVPAWYSTVGWTGCTATDNNCSVNMDADKSVTATFTGNNNVRLNSATPTLHSRIMDAYNAIGVSGSGNIQAQVFTFLESPVFGNPVSVLLEGGRSASFDPTSGYSTVGTLSILKGSVTISNIVIK